MRSDRKRTGWFRAMAVIRPALAFLTLTTGCGNPGIPGGGGNGGGNTGTNPVGLFFNRFSGTLSGTELVQILTTSQSRVYLVSALNGEGLICQIATGGAMTVQDVISGAGEASGMGQFTASRSFVLEPTITIPGRFDNAPFDYTGSRIAGTSTDIPLEATAASANNDMVGEYEATVADVNPETGTIGSTTTETLQVTLEGSALRITRPSGAYYQGIFVSNTRVAFRMVNGATGRFASFPGSENNVGLDMVGLADFDIPRERLAVTLVFQSRDVRGVQQQTQLFINGQLVPDGGGGTTVTVQCTNLALEPVNVQLLSSTNANATESVLLSSGAREFSRTLAGFPTSPASSDTVSCTRAGSIILVATEALECSESVVSQVLQQPANFDCNDLIAFTVTGSCSAGFQIQATVTPR